MPDSFMTTKWLLNCHEFMIRFRGNKPYKLKTDLSLTLKSMQQKKEYQLPQGNFKQPNAYCVCNSREQQGHQMKPVCTPQRLGKWNMQSADDATATADAAASGTAPTATFYSSQPEQSRQHSSQAKLEANETMQKCKRKIFAYVKVRCKYGMWFKAKANKPQHWSFNPHEHAHVHTHHTHHKMAQCVQKYVYLMPVLTSESSFAFVCWRPSSHCCHLFNIFCTACNRAATTKGNICGDAFKKTKKRKAKNKICQHMPGSSFRCTEKGIQQKLNAL